jgi:hypothetical protein
MQGRLDANYQMLERFKLNCSQLVAKDLPVLTHAAWCGFLLLESSNCFMRIHQSSHEYPEALGAFHLLQEGKGRDGGQNTIVPASRCAATVFLKRSIF